MELCNEVLLYITLGTKKQFFTFNNITMKANRDYNISQ